MSMDSAIENIGKKVSSGERLTEGDALDLFRSHDILSLGEMANSVAGRLHGERAYYTINCHINPTNICVNRCALCAFSRSPGDAGTYTLTPDDILARAENALTVGATELHIVGGLHPDFPFDFYLTLIRSLHERFPMLTLKAFTAVEVDYFSRISGLSLVDVLKALMEAGVSCLPGGGAEIFDPVVRKRICGPKISANEWLNVMETAHSLGLKTTATMLYGHVESLENRVAHISRIRALQDRTGGFLCFIPLLFHPQNTRVTRTAPASGYDDLKTIAVSRLFLDNIPHIKAYWIMLGEKIAQIALNFGADDLDGTILGEHITHEAGAESPTGLSAEDLSRLIRAAGKEPVQRDSFYKPLRGGGS